LRKSGGIDPAAFCRLRYIIHIFLIDVYSMKKYSCYRTLIAIVLACLAVSGTAHADGDTKAPAAAQHYLAPEDITREDYDMMSDYAYRYDSCLDQVSQEQMDKQSDPLHVVDYAMKQCAPKLEELDRKMIARNFDPVYRQNFIGNVNRKSVNNTLRNVMMDMASRQSQASGPAQ
jgi:hypothetical protein